MFIVIGTDESNTSSVFTKKGWHAVTHKTNQSSRFKAVALDNAAACKARDDAKANSLNKGITFHVIEVEQA